MNPKLFKQIMEVDYGFSNKFSCKTVSLTVMGDADQGFDRRMYFTIINPSDGKGNENGMRSYTCLDLYPTTLSSLGVAIEGDRLGLGVDLYSSTPTLVEQYGLEYLNVELQKNSEYYKEKLLYN